jgi:hypothetical protein
MTSKKISEKTKNGITKLVYRHDIMAGMEFCYTKGETKNNRIKPVGYYYFTIVLDQNWQTIQEIKGKNIFYKR